jgi:inhibitor of cysteine peptidase
MNRRPPGFMFPVMGMLLILATGGPAQSFAQEPPSGEVVVTAADDGHEIELTEGQTLVVRLRANPSTGYAWQVVEPAGGEVLRQTDDAEFQPDSSLLGAPATQIVRLEPVQEGDTAVKLEYRRPWEPAAEPLLEFGLQVRAVGPFLAMEQPETPQRADQTSEHLGQGASQDLPPAFNWCDLDGCTPVKDQGQCGSCWAFATVGALELNIIIRAGEAEDLSEQYLVSCNSEGWGCDGGSWAHDYHFWKVPAGDEGAGGVLETAFAYAAGEEACEPPHPHLYQIKSWEYVGEGLSVPSLIDIKRAIYEHGPVAAALCVNSAFQGYGGGVFEGPGCILVNHAVLLVGWDDEQGQAGVWHLRNSWGPEWGEEGYMRIGYGVSNVGFGANYVVYMPSSCYSLATSVTPDAAGIVDLDPSPDCADDQYSPGTEVQLTARESPGWRFVSWSEATAGDRPTTSVVVNAHKSVTAHYQTEVCLPWFVLPLGLAVCWSLKQRRWRAG